MIKIDLGDDRFVHFRELLNCQKFLEQRKKLKHNDICALTLKTLDPEGIYLLISHIPPLPNVMVNKKDCDELGFMDAILKILENYFETEEIVEEYAGRIQSFGFDYRFCESWIRD